jgi:uncharacterized Zn-binding protein involved in type VI secretion
MSFVHQGNGGFENYDRRGVIGLIFTWLMLLLMTVPAIAMASHDDDNAYALFGPKKYVRIPGKPYTWTSTFTACSVPSSATLQLTNGSGSKSRVSSAVVTLNGVKVIAEKDLNQNVPTLARTVNLKAGLNTVTVTIKSGSGSNDDNGGEHNDGGDEHSGDGENDPAAEYLTLQISGKACGSSDTAPPVFSAPQPSDGRLLAIAKPPISIAFSDNSGGSGVDTASVRVSLDGSDITGICSVSATGIACTPAGNLNDGMHSVTVAVSDLAKNMASYSWRFSIDTTPPKITVTTPQNGQNLGNPLFNVTGTVDDASANITVNGISATLSGLAFSAANVPLLEGANTITIIALDQLGNQSTTALNVTLDTSLPVVTITAPLNGNSTNIPILTVNGTINEASTGVTVNGRSATLTGQSFTLENLPLAEGQNSIAVEASDLAGNKGRAIVSVTLDTVKPQIFVTTPADALLTRNPQLTVSGTVSEPLTSLTVNGQTATITGQTCTTLLTLNEGVNSITLEATDRAGNKSSVAISVTLDSTPPVVPVLEALASPTNNPLVVVKGSAEPGSIVSLSSNGSVLASTKADISGLFSFAGLTLTEGETLFTAWATDSAGNAGQPSAPLAVVLDTVAPSLAVSNPLDGTILNTPVITISGTIVDPSAVVSVNGLAAINSGSAWTLGNFTLQEGKNTLLVEARDPAGNKGSVSATIVLDTVAPVVTISAPLDGLYTNIPQFTVSGTVNEDVASVTVNGVAATISTVSPGSSLFTATLTLTERTNSIVVTAIDKAGNRGTATVNVTLDTIAPQLTVIGPDDGALLNNGQIIFGGNTAEPVSSVLVNGVAAQAGTNGGYTLPVTLLEGSNTLTVTATDRAGNRTTSTINVTLDSTPPAAPMIDPLATPTRIGTTAVSGQAEANAQVKLFNNGQIIATLKANTSGLFSVPPTTLTEGNNAFTAQAVDTAGNASLLSAPLTVVLDTKAPAITVTAPQPGMVISTAQVTIKGTVDEPLASLTVNGGAAILNGNAFEYLMTLAAGENSALITATDLAGNVATTTLTIQRDSIPPKVSISAPLSGLLTNNPQIQVSGTVDDPEAVVTVGGAAVTVLNKTYSVEYLLTDGDNSIVVKAVDKAGNEGMASVVVTLDAKAPVVTLTAPATATAGTDVQISVNATDNRTLTLVDVSADGASLWSAAPLAATAGQTVSLRLSPTLAPGAVVTLRARALDAAGNIGSATAAITIDKAADGPGFIQGKVLDDNRGLPLEGAQVRATDSKGQTQNVTTTADGAWFFELSSGLARVEVSKNGFTSVRRDVIVRPGQRTSVLDSRLTKLDAAVHLVDVTGSIVKSTPFKTQNSSYTIDVQIPANALTVRADARLTPVSNQGLITPLPLGWSPLAAVEFSLLDPVTALPVDPQPLSAPSVLTVPLPAGLGDAALTAQLARYDATRRAWLAIAEIAIAANATTASAPISQPGQYALLLADPAPINPPAPIQNQELPAASIAVTDFTLITATGRVVPQAAPPSAGLRAAGDLLLVAKADAATAPALISGLVVNARVTEKFDLIGGTTVQPNATTQDIVLYRRPCVTAIAGGVTEPPFDSAQGPTLRTTFPVSPSRDFTIVDLLMGKLKIDITQPDTSGGVMVGADGARLLQPDGTALSIPAGALTATVPVTVATIPEASLATLIGSDFRLLRGVDIAITGQTLKSSATLSIPAPAGFNPSLPVVVAKKFDIKGGSKLKLVAAAKLSGSIINSELLTPELSNSTNSINSSGQYLFLQAVAPIGYVSGQITDASAAAFAGIQVTAQSATLADLTGITGQYLLALAAGSQTVTALDSTRGDAASGSVTIAANSKSILNLTVRMVPPKVTDITPTNGAINVQPDVPVVITFSKPMDKNSVTSSTLVVRGAGNAVIPGMITWNAEATIATFYPTEAFSQETSYTVTIAGTVRDLQSYQLGQGMVTSFTIRRTTLPALPPAGAISGTFPDADGYITVTGTQGSAETGNTVLLINDTSGEIQSVTPASNGSFTGKVRGQLGDEIKVVLMDYSGNQTVISYLTFKGQDGSYLVSAKGGTITGEGGSQLDIPEGALVGATVLKITGVPEANLPSPVQAPGTFLSAVNIDSGGLDFRKEIKISIPVPAGFNPATPVFLTRPGEIINADGSIEKVYEIIDSTKIVNGRITTASPPFDGIMGWGTYIFIAYVNIEPVIVSGITYQEMNGLPGYQALPEGFIDGTTKDSNGNPVYRYDRPLQGAIIRSSDAMNSISYSKSDGRYAAFTNILTGLGELCKRFRVTAINPRTMYRGNFDGELCSTTNHVVNDLNFKLAEKDTIPPDRTAPVISMSLNVVSGQAPDKRIVAGTTPVGTKLNLPVSIIDQAMGSVMFTVNYSETGIDKGSPTPYVILPPKNPVLHSYIKEEHANLYRYDYTAQFSQDAALNYFVPSVPGYYLFKIEATDAAGNKNSRTLDLHAVATGTSLVTPVDGPPRIDAIFPEDKTKDVMVTTQIVATFNEPVQNVESNFKLYDTNGTTPVLVPAKIITSIEAGRMLATLIPNGNLYYARDYKIVLSTGIKDTEKNPSAPNQPPAGDGLYNLQSEYSATFKTKVPTAYDLDADQQFTGGRSIDVYTFTDQNGESNTYAYITAHDKGWKISDVTDPTDPGVVFTASPTCASGSSATEDCRYISPYPITYFRNLAVHPDNNKALLAITENIVTPDASIADGGAQYGYIRFYDLSTDPGNPPVIGQERLSEAYSGIPGRVAMWGDYAVVNSAVAGIQIVNIQSAIKRKTGKLQGYGISIAGVLDTESQGYGSPADLSIFNERSAVFTTTSGQLLTVDLNLSTDQKSIDNNEPVLPVLLNAFKPSGYNFSRIATATGYQYTDKDGVEQIINLAVTSTTQGKVVTIDVTDPISPKILGTATKADGTPVTAIVSDITVSKDAGLAYVTTYNSIQVYDIKDPTKPRLLNELTSLSDQSGAMLPLGETPGLVEKDGWLYMANMAKGMKTLELGGKKYKRLINCNSDCAR